MWVRIFFKTAFLSLCDGLARLVTVSEQPAILMYHSFNTARWKYSVTPANLEKQIAYLVQNRPVISLADLQAWLCGQKDIPHNAVVITIDDGYEDTYSVFFPLAQKYNLPFTLFLTTDLTPLKKLGNFPRPTIAQLKEMFASGLMSLGVHGHSHINFTEVLEQGIEKIEIEDSRAFMEVEFGIKVNAVAYPAGRTSEAVFAYIKQAGYEIGCTTRPGFVNKNSDPLRLFRIEVDSETSVSLFSGRLGPGFPFFLTLLRVFRRGRFTRTH